MAVFPPPASSPPSPTRTTFAITLQLARAIAALQALVRAGHCGDRLGVRRAARKVTVDILRGARDRSRDPHLRPLLAQQRRTTSLVNPRLRPPRAPRTIATSGKARASATPKATR